MSNYVWVFAWDDLTSLYSFYKVNPDTGVTDERITTSHSNAAAFSWDNDNLWVADGGPQIYKYDLTGTLVDTLNIENAGVFEDVIGISVASNGDVWVSAFYADIYHLNSTASSVIAQYSAIESSPGGWGHTGIDHDPNDDDIIWIAFDSIVSNPCIGKFSISQGTTIAQYGANSSSYDGGNGVIVRPHGIGVVGDGTFWTNEPNGNYIVRADLETCEAIEWYAQPGYPISFASFELEPVVPPAEPPTYDFIWTRIWNVKSITINYDGGLSGSVYVRKFDDGVFSIDPPDGPTFWWRPETLSGSTVDSWTNEGSFGVGYDLTTLSSGHNAPAVIDDSLNNYPIVRFTAAEATGLSTSSTADALGAPSTFAMLFRIRTGSTRVFRSRASNSAAIYTISNELRWGAGVKFSDLVINDWYLLVGSKTGNTDNHDWWLNGTHYVYGTWSYDNLSGMDLGWQGYAGGPSHGDVDIAESIGWKRDLNADGEMDDLLTYFRLKYPSVGII